MDIQVECRPEPLDQRDRTGAGRLMAMPRLPDQMRGNDAVNDAQHAPHDLRTTGEQEAAVSEPFREYLWVLSRTPTVEPIFYQALMQRLRDQQFDTSKLEMTLQSNILRGAIHSMTMTQNTPPTITIATNANVTVFHGALILPLGFQPGVTIM